MDMLIKQPDSLNNENIVETKRKKEEDLKLVRESLQALEDQISNGLELSREDEERFVQFEEAEKLLEAEIAGYNKLLLAFIEGAKDGLKKSSDLMDTGKATSFRDLDDKEIRKGTQRKVVSRRNHEIMVLETQVLFDKHRNFIKQNKIGSVEGIFKLFWPERHWDNSGKKERAIIKTELVKFYGIILAGGL